MRVLDPAVTLVTLNVVERAHNYIYVTSAEIPELHLWGSPEVVTEQLEPALKALFKHNNGVDVDVYLVRDPRQFPKPSAPGPGEIPTQYVVAMAA